MRNRPGSDSTSISLYSWHPGSLRDLAAKGTSKARKEPGCHEYKLMEVESEPGRFLTFERWSGHAALDKHMKTPDIAALGPKLGALLSKPFTQIFLGKPQVK